MIGVSVRYVRKLAAQKKLTFVADRFGTFSAPRAQVDAFIRERRARAAHAALLRERVVESGSFGRGRVERASGNRGPYALDADVFDDSPDTERSAHWSHDGDALAERPVEEDSGVGRLRVEIQGGTLAVFGSKLATAIVIGDSAVVVGRNKRCTVVLDDKKISKLHAAFVATEHGVRLRDLGSRNGTYIGSVRVWEVYLTEATSVYCGGTKLHFRPARTAGRRRRAAAKTPSR